MLGDLTHKPTTQLNALYLVLQTLTGTTKRNTHVECMANTILKHDHASLHALRSFVACRLEMLRQQNPSDVDVAITPEELEGLDETSIQALYNQRVAEERARNAREVCSVL